MPPFFPSLLSSLSLSHTQHSTSNCHTHSIFTHSLPHLFVCIRSLCVYEYVYECLCEYATKLILWKSTNLNLSATYDYLNFTLLSRLISEITNAKILLLLKSSMFSGILSIFKYWEIHNPAQPSKFTGCTSPVHM